MENPEPIIAAVVGADELREHYFGALRRLESAAAGGRDEDFSVASGVISAEFESDVTIEGTFDIMD